MRRVYDPDDGWIEDQGGRRRTQSNADPQGACDSAKQAYGPGTEASGGKACTAPVEQALILAKASVETFGHDYPEAAAARAALDQAGLASEPQA